MAASMDMDVSEARHIRLPSGRCGLAMIGDECESMHLMHLYNTGAYNIYIYVCMYIIYTSIYNHVINIYIDYVYK